MNGRLYRWICLGLVLSVTVGCGGAEEEAENVLNGVRGVITINGKPAPDGTIVTLIPKEGGDSGQQIFGTYISDENNFAIRTVKDGENFSGAPEGEYAITIQSPKNKPTAIPAKYGKPETSGLTVEVKKGFNAVPEIKLAP
ncbi:MAG: hypothetical protein JWN70_5656 [Planctomycetaceae bacterium]|nr:hypothetical protein [Planctomycetaceae bacterium]